MDTAVFVLVSVLVGGLALAFYMDWLGLWVSKKQMTEQIERRKERMQGLGKQNGDKVPKTGGLAQEEAEVEASGTRF
jgi:uncharacterized protein YneF (UPF0154 family)